MDSKSWREFVKCVNPKRKKNTNAAAKPSEQKKNWKPTKKNTISHAVNSPTKTTSTDNYLSHLIF